MSIGLGTHIHRAARRHPGHAALVDHGEIFSTGSSTNGPTASPMRCWISG
jgi:hypothetical protein